MSKKLDKREHFCLGFTLGIIVGFAFGWAALQTLAALMIYL